LRDAAEEHRGIYQAIRAGDAERARRAMAEHLRRAEHTQALEDSNGEA
jgi:DNA-binding FadR family transcriptional regulator